MAVVSMGLGILGLASAAVPLYGFMAGFPLAIAGLVPGILVLRRSTQRRQLATAAVTLCALGLLAAVFNLVLSSAAIPYFF